MKSTRHLLFLVSVCMSINIYGQSYFYSIGSPKRYMEPPVTDVAEDSVDTASVELPEEVVKICLPSVTKDVKLVSLPLDNLHCTSPFGHRRDPFNGKSRMHSGIDLRARFEDVHAMLPGTVIKTGYSKTAGFFVTLSHGICVCSYLHLSKILVKENDHVSAGDVVAVSGCSGLRCTGPHLHLSCRWNDSKGKYFNPVLLLGFVAAKLNRN